MTLARPPETPDAASRAGGALRRLGRLALWGGPLGVGLALAVLLAGAAAGHFRSGPEAPAAGDPRGWTELWGALGLVTVGTLVGVLANAGWAAAAARRGRRPTPAEWARLAVHALLLAILAWALGGG